MAERPRSIVLRSFRAGLGEALLKALQRFRLGKPAPCAFLEDPASIHRRPSAARRRSASARSRQPFALSSGSDIRCGRLPSMPTIRGRRRPLGSSFCMEWLRPVGETADLPSRLDDIGLLLRRSLGLSNFLVRFLLTLGHPQLLLIGRIPKPLRSWSSSAIRTRTSASESLSAASPAATETAASAPEGSHFMSETRAAAASPLRSASCSHRPSADAPRANCRRRHCPR